MSNGMNPLGIYGRLIMFLRMLYHQKYCQLGLQEEMKESSQTPKILHAGNRLKNYSAANTYSTSWKSMTQTVKLRAEPQAQRMELRAQRAEL